jgi:hypothetical protein
MPRINFNDRLRAVLVHHAVAPDLQRHIMNDLFSPTSSFSAEHKKQARNENAWTVLLGDVRQVLLGLRSNMHKQPECTKEIYERYVATVLKARDDIIAASTMLVKDPANPGGPRVPATVKDTARLAAKRNTALKENGPTCNSRWHTWVHPDAILELRNAFEVAYIAAGRKGGKRVTPFLTPEVARYNADRLHALRSFIESQRQVLARNYPSNTPYSHVPHHALHLCALRMAERTLDTWEEAHAKNKYHGLDNPLPVKWIHLLDHTMRERVTRADASPLDVSIEGIESFYKDDGSARTPSLPETPEQRAANKEANGWD